MLFSAWLTAASLAAHLAHAANIVRVAADVDDSYADAAVASLK